MDKVSANIHADESNARRDLVAIAGAPLVCRSLSVVAELAIVDLLSEKARTASDLANATGCEPRMLYRLLRFLASHGYFVEDEQERFHATPKVDPLRTDALGSLRDLFVMGMQDLLWDAQRHLETTIRTGQPGFDVAYGDSFFSYLAKTPEANKHFDSAMAISSGPENQSVVAAYDFDDQKTVVDIGGGQGGLLAMVLQANAHLQGVLFDQPQVADDPRYLREANVLDRCRIETGDFFESVPKGGDLYFLKRILHDWDDPTVLKILKNCRAAMEPGARLLAVEAVIQPGNERDANKYLDVSIMTLLRGRERTAAEFHDLFQMAGFQMTGVIETPAPSTLFIVEGIPI